MKIGILALVCVFTIAAVVGVATAAVTPNASAAQVITTNIKDGTTLVTEFAPRQTIYVEYSIQSGKTANIAIYDEAGNLMTGTLHEGVKGSGEFTFSTLQPGTYYVVADGTRLGIGVASFFVLPETALGAFGAIGAGLAAFGIVKYKSAKTSKI